MTRHEGVADNGLNLLRSFTFYGRKVIRSRVRIETEVEGTIDEINSDRMRLVNDEATYTIEEYAIKEVTRL